MDDSRFSRIADDMLSELFARLEEKSLEDQSDAGAYEVDFDGQVITLDLEDGRQYVVNKHMASRQIWLSSPISGANHYRFDEEKKEWMNTRENRLGFPQILFDELREHTGVDLS